MAKVRSLTICLAGFALLLWQACVRHSPAELLTPQDTSFLLTNLYHNAYLSWHPDTIISVLPSTVQQEGLLIIFLLGLAFFFNSLPPTRGLSLNAAAAFVAGAAISSFARGDKVLLHALVWWPWLLAALKLYSTKETVSNVTVFAVAALAWQVSASSSVLAGPMALLSVAIAAPFFSNSAQRNAALIATLFPAALALAYYAPPPWPQYPAGATLVPSSGLPGIIRPLVGYAPNLPSIDRLAVKAVCFYPCLALLLCLVFSFRQSVKNQIFWLAVSLTVFAACDIFLSEHYASIGPLAVVGRIVPLAGLYPVTTLVIPVVIIVLSCALKHTWCLLPGAAILAASLPGPSLPPMDIEKIPHASPSAPLYARYGEKSITFKRDHQHPSSINVSRNVEKVTASTNLDALPSISDHSPETRWSSQSVGQKGGEYVTVYLTELHQYLVGIAARAGAFWTDFPAALIVRAGEDCGQPPSTWGIVAKEEPWFGPVQFTSSGEPFYGSQSKVQVLFNEPVLTTCLHIEQTGERRVYDWSIAELELLVAR